jgi:iron complex transport system substrate-binding protein
MRNLLSNIVTIGMIAAGLALLAGSPADAKVVTDQAGRRVEIPDRPRRVVSLAPSITEIVFALGQEQILKGVTSYSNFPPQASGLPRVGSYVRLDIERIIELRPDLCIAVKDGNPKATVDRLQALGVPVYALDPRSVPTVIQAILEMGAVLNAGDQAERLARDMRSRIQRVTDRLAGAVRRPRVFFQIGDAPIVSVGTNTFAHELIGLAGGNNVAAGATGYPRFNREQVLALAPDVIVISSMDRTGSIEQTRQEWSRWPSVPAVRDNRIHLVDSDIFDRPSPRLVTGLEQLAGFIHPEIFGDPK